MFVSQLPPMPARQAPRLLAALPFVVRRRVALRIAVCLGAVLLAACGAKKEAEADKPRPKRPMAEPKVEGEGTAVDGWIVLGENPKWKPIKPLFEAYAKREVTGLHNPVRSNLVWFVEKPVPTTTKVDDEPVDHPKEKLEITAFTKFKLSQLVLFMLVSGVPQPKAVLLDQEGNQLVVVHGDHLGSEGGVVKAITQYELQVSVPGEPDVVKSLKPPLNPVEEIDAETQGAGKKPGL